MSKPHITIYTDGGADPNPGPGGWAAILIHPQREHELSGGEADTTNNRMELTAAIEALKALTTACAIDFYTDSEYLRKGITEWIDGWVKKGWGEIKNVDLWQALHKLVQQHEIKWHWVKGHAGNRYNERADQLASAEIRKLKGVPEAATDRTHVYMQIAGKGTTFGWAAAIVRDGQAEIWQGGHPTISVNHFSLWAVLQIIERLPSDEPIQFFSNNSYLVDGITQWVNGWRKANWQKDIKFKEDWQRLDALNQSRDILWTRFDHSSEPQWYMALHEPVQEALRQVGGGGST